MCKKTLETKGEFISSKREVCCRRVCTAVIMSTTECAMFNISRKPVANGSWLVVAAQLNSVSEPPDCRDFGFEKRVYRHWAIRGVDVMCM
ncbi:hypothetical protein KIN20_010346 [Parelaphostrongylus tenuis]|uniref:Uncharacterized protein n=1 Tax=Parelaphostrongylus tenuis TaxID=148309 RepID=A0AAD5QP26_PARTN|nr:hypothetical protein KIN20_010346 [Parelaphostrongylus tenuis]